MQPPEPASIAPSPPTLCVLIPCLNEAQAIRAVVAEYRAVFPWARILVVDNGSDDDTAGEAQAAGAAVVHERIRGKGRAFLKGLSLVREDLLLLVDGDGTYPAEGGRALLEVWNATGADLITGVRRSTSNGGTEFRPLHQTGTQMFGKALGLLFGVRQRDVFSGLRLLSRRFYRNLPVLSRGFELEMEMTAQAIDKGFTLGEAEVPYRERVAGTQSKLRTFRDGARILRMLLQLARDYKPLFFFGSHAVLFAAAGLAAGTPPVLGYLQTGLVGRLPLAVLAASLMNLALFCLLTGVMLESGLRAQREAFQIRARREDEVPR